MAVNQTGAIYKAMTIDGESSRTYGVYITGQAVYNAPQREVEMISIPGRNGQLALDKGRFENIEVTYPAGIYADTEADFAEAVSNFRNFLCSRDGYVRIEDEYNPNEYRMGVYKSGLEVTPAMLKAGEFDITFDCKPQRWLKSGETAVTVDSGDVISNPTLFESSPMLEVDGYGEIGIGGETISIQNEEIGRIRVASPVHSRTSGLSLSQLNTGDTIDAEGNPEIEVVFTYGSSSTVDKFTIRKISTTAPASVSITKSSTTKWVASFRLSSSVSFEKGTNQTVSGTVTLEFTYSKTGQATTTKRKTFTISLAYVVANSTMALSLSNDGTTIDPDQSIRAYYNPQYAGISTKSALPSPLYVDLDIGEAYGEIDGEIISLNDNATIPSDLPKLSSGANTITFDNTITELKVIPRWWKV